MIWLKNPHLNLTAQRIFTDRCILIPFSLDAPIDFHELQEEFCRANKNLYISPFLPAYEEEVSFIKNVAEGMKEAQSFENFILEKNTGKLLGAIGLNTPEDHRMNIGLWIREDEQGKGYATETYTAILDWARENTTYTYLKHSLNPENIPSQKLALKFGWIPQDELSARGHIIYHTPL